jgi:hypothetical protein
VAIRRSHGRGKQDRADDNQYDGEGVPKAEPAATKFAEKKEKSNSGDDGWAHEPADGATAAAATNFVGHGTVSSKTAGFRKPALQ